MAFEIEEIKSSIKKNPVPWAVGLTVAVGAGLYVYYSKSKGAESYITEAYPAMPVMPEETGSVSDGGGGGTGGTGIDELIAELEQMRYEDLQQTAEFHAQLLEQLNTTLTQYAREQVQQVPQEPIHQTPQEPLYLKHLKGFGSAETYAGAIKEAAQTGRPLADPLAAAQFQKDFPQYFVPEPSYIKHIKGFGSTEAYAEAIKKVVASGRPLADPVAAAEFEKAYPQYFTKK